MKVIAGLPCWTLNGPSIWAARLVRGLSESGADARILLTESDTEHIASQATSNELPEDIEFDRLPAGRHDSWCLRWLGLIRYLEEQAPCTYLMSTDWRNNVVAPRLSDRVRLVGSVHADYELEYEQAGRLGRTWDAVVSVSEVLTLQIAERFPELLPRVVTIPNGVPVLDRISSKPPVPPLRIAYSGELRETQKRLGDVIEVARQLERLGTDFVLTFIGDGPLRGSLEAKTRDLTEAGKVRFLGVLANLEVMEELKRQHVLLLTSEYEGLSIALLEAMSRGCVPVVTDLATQSVVVIDGENGLSVPVGDVAAFASRLVGLASDPARLAELGAAAFATVSNGRYRLEDSVAAYHSLFERLDGSVRRRARGEMAPPPRSIGGIGILPGDHQNDAVCVNLHPLWPNLPRQAVPASPRRGANHSPTSARLVDHKVILSTSFNQISGVDVFCGHLARGLRDRGVDVRLLNVNTSYPATGWDPKPDISIDEPWMPPFATWQVRWRRMREYLESHGPCIYVPNYAYEDASVAPTLAGQVKVVTIAHSDDPVYYDLMMRIGSASNALVTVSDAVANEIVRLLPAMEQRLQVIRYGVEVPDRPPSPRRRSPDEPLRVVYAGRLVSYQKRVLDVIWIARALEQRGVPFVFFVVGDGAERDTLLSLGHQLVMGGKLRYVGTVSNDQMAGILAQADAFIMPSAFEGLSIGMLEAMAQGVVPVVSAVRSGVPEVIRPGVNGMVAPVGDAERFADHLALLHRHPSARTAMGQLAHKTVSASYRVDQMVERYVDMLEEAVSDRRVRSRGPIAPPHYLVDELRPRIRARRWLGMKVRRAKARVL